MTLPVTDPVLIVAITMGILLIGPLLFERLRMPGLVGLIALGALVGPSVLGLIARDATFELLGTFGLLYLMFLAGVTLDLNEFTRQRGVSVGFGVLSFGLPMGLALISGPLLLGYNFTAAALLGAIVGSHTLLALPLAGRLGIVKNRAVVAATGATLVTDVLSLVVLAVVTALVGGASDVWFWVRFAGLAILWAAGVILIVPRLARTFFRRVRREADTAFAFLFAVVFVTAWLASLVGLAPIIGAFLAGLALNRLVPAGGPLMTRLRFVGEAVFIPFFLVSVGLLVDVRVLGSAEVWLIALAFTALVVIGKGAAALLSRPLFRFSATESAVVAGLTMPQAAATLAVTLIGFDIGLFSQVAVNAVVLLIVLTCLIGPSLVGRFGRTLALADRQAPEAAGSAPQRIAIPLSNPETAEDLVELALLLRDPKSSEPVFPLAIARGEHGERQAVAQAERLMERAVLHAAAADVPCVPTVRIDENPAEGILRGVRELRASTLVAGWSADASAGSFVFGSVLDGVLASAREMVVVARLVHPIGTARRALVLVPPRMIHEPGAAAGVQAVKTMAAKQGHALTLVLAEDEADEARAFFERLRPEVPLTVSPLPGWSHLLGTLRDLVTPGDLVTLLNVRKGAVAWRPALERLPRLLARRFAQTDLLLVYLPEEGVALPESTVPADQGAFDFPVGHIALRLDPGPPASVLRRILLSRFRDEPRRAARLADELLAHAQGHPPEVMPGVAFYHLHTDEVVRPMVFAATFPDGVPMPDTGGLIRVVLLLLVPASMPAESYLRQLALTARILRRPEAVEALLAADSPENARALLLEGARQAISEDRPLPAYPSEQKAPLLET
ncbi:MAG: cation:proton antiporter [Rubricoccaceae bacterium]